MDEAGLPEESMESLKVSTYITNISFVDSFNLLIISCHLGFTQVPR